MQITDLYQTQITCSTYNANIDSTNTVITVTLKDFNGAAVTNKSVTLTCDKGYFNKNGSTAISGTTTKSITATTNSSGQITATWTASEWGLCTFSANNINAQIQVSGWKQISSSNGITVRTNNDSVKVIIVLSAILTQWQRIQIGSINSTYAPQHLQITPCHTNNPQALLTLMNDGKISAYTSGSSGSASINAELYYAKK